MSSRICVDDGRTRPAKVIVLDANILIRVILGRRVQQLIQTYAGQGVRFFAPDDAEKYLPPLLEKRGKPEVDVPESLDYLRNFIDVEFFGTGIAV